MLEIHILHIDFDCSNRLETIPPFPLQELHRFDLYFSALIQRLICFVRLYPYEGTQYLSLFQ